MNPISTTLPTFHSPQLPLRSIPSLQDICDSTLFKLDSNFDPINPDFYNAFAKTSEGSKEQNFSLQWLSKKSAIEIATLPFFAEASNKYTNLVVNTLEEVLINGTADEKKKACGALLKSYENSELSDSTRKLTKVFLLLFLERMPAIEKASMSFPVKPFNEYSTIIINALEELLEWRFSGELKETDDEMSTAEKKIGLSKVLCALLSSCQNSELPESTREVTKSFLLKFISTEDVAIDCNDEETVILLKKEFYLTLRAITSLEKSCDKAIRSSDHRVSEIHLNDYNQKKIQVMYSLVDQYTSTVQLIYSYLKNNVEQIDDVFLDDAINDFFNPHSYTCPFKKIFETLIVLSDNLTTKEEAKSFLDLHNELDLGSRLTQDCMDYLIKAVGNSKRPRSTFWLGCKYIESQTSESVMDKHFRLICNYYNENIFDYFPGHQFRLPDHSERSDLQAIKYLSCAAITGYAPAIQVLGALGMVVSCPDTLMMLTDIVEKGQIIGFDDKAFAAELRGRMVQYFVNINFGGKFDVYAEQKKYKNEESYVKSLSSSYIGRGVLELLCSYDNKALGLEAKFEMGKYFFLAGGNPILIGTPNGQELLENSARNGHVKAAIFVVHHYLYRTPHQPKFKSTYSAPEHSNFKALQFLDIAVKIACQNGKAEIARNKIPDSLNEIIKQLDPTARGMLFSLSEQYEHSKTEDDAKLADVLFKIALDAKQPAALKKLKRLEEELQQELAIKLQRKMEDMGKHEKSTVVSL